MTTTPNAINNGPTGVPGVPTIYAGTVFRSRLESRWAAFADLAGWSWVYEPFDGNGYLPDFCFTISGRPVLVEVKPVATIDDARAHLPKIIRGIGDLWNHDVIIAGVDPSRTLYIDFLHDPSDWHSGCGELSVCPECSSLELHPAPWSMGCPKCGIERRLPGEAYAHVLWRQAGNLTRWEAAG